MAKHFAVATKEGYFTSNQKFTKNENLAYVYETQEEAQRVADYVGGIVVLI